MKPGERRVATKARKGSCFMVALQRECCLGDPAPRASIVCGVKWESVPRFRYKSLFPARKLAHITESGTSGCLSPQEVFFCRQSVADEENMRKGVLGRMCFICAQRVSLFPLPHYSFSEACCGESLVPADLDLDDLARIRIFSQLSQRCFLRLLPFKGYTFLLLPVPCGLLFF